MAITEFVIEKRDYLYVPSMLILIRITLQGVDGSL